MNLAQSSQSIIQLCYCAKYCHKSMHFYRENLHFPGICNQKPISFLTQTKDNNICEFVPSIHANPVKFLGRVITASLSDSEKIESFA